jgi:hypothetical protein
VLARAGVFPLSVVCCPHQSKPKGILDDEGGDTPQAHLPLRKQTQHRLFLGYTIVLSTKA